MKVGPTFGSFVAMLLWRSSKLTEGRKSRDDPPGVSTSSAAAFTGTGNPYAPPVSPELRAARCLSSPAVLGCRDGGARTGEVVSERWRLSLSRSRLASYLFRATAIRFAIRLSADSRSGRGEIWRPWSQWSFLVPDWLSVRACKVGPGLRDVSRCYGTRVAGLPRKASADSQAPVRLKIAPYGSCGSIF